MYGSNIFGKLGYLKMCLLTPFLCLISIELDDNDKVKIILIPHHMMVEIFGI